MQTRKASIKETGEELSPADWERFDAAVADLKGERQKNKTPEDIRERPPGPDKKGQAVA